MNKNTTKKGIDLLDLEYLLVPICFFFLWILIVERNERRKFTFSSEWAMTSSLIFCRRSFLKNSECSLVWNFRKQVGNRMQNEQTKEEPFVSFQLWKENRNAGFFLSSEWREPWIPVPQEYFLRAHARMTGTRSYWIASYLAMTEI